MTNLLVAQGIDRSELSAMLLAVPNKIKVRHVSTVSPTSIYSSACAPLICAPSAYVAERPRVVRLLLAVNPMLSVSLGIFASVGVSLASTGALAQSLGGTRAP